MSERPFMQLYVSDFLGDTLQLSAEQIGAYMLLLMAMWNARGRLPADDAKLARVARVSIKKWRSISPDLMAFFESDEESVWSNRLLKELQKSESKSQLRASAGARGGAAKALKYNEATLANATAEPKHLPDTRDQKKKETRASRASSPPGFDEFWSRYPNKIGKPAALRAFASAVKRSPVETIMAGLARYIAKTDDRPWCNPSTWLNQDRWGDEPAAGSQRSTEAVVEDEGRWRTRLRAARQKHMWSTAQWGPMPGCQGCRAPPHLIEPGDGDGWSEWAEAA